MLSWSINRLADGEKLPRARRICENGLDWAGLADAMIATAADPRGYLIATGLDDGHSSPLPSILNPRGWWVRQRKLMRGEFMLQAIRSRYRCDTCKVVYDAQERIEVDLPRLTDKDPCPRHVCKGRVRCYHEGGLW
jgi:hypothetical protein